MSQSRSGQTWSRRASSGTPLKQGSATKFHSRKRGIPLTMLDDMLPHLGHGLAHSRVVVEQLAMPPSIPLGKSRQLLRDGVEQPHNDTNRHRLHIIAELLDGDGVGHAVVAVKLDLLPDGEQDG